LLRGLEAGGGYTEIAGLSYRNADGFHHNRDRAVSHLTGDDIQPPRRDVRVLRGYTMLGRQVDVVETSRGCTFDCSFCSIIEMRGRNFETFDLTRVIADIRDAYDHGARAVFLVDDNITLNVHRFETLCRKIVEAKLHRIDYIVQAMTSSIANHGETLAPLMRQAGFRYVFLGIENVLDDGLAFLRARSKNEERKQGHIVGNATLKAIDCLHRNQMYVVGGLIVGNPDDTPESIEANLEFARRYVDWPYIQHPTPYPRTPMTSELRERGLIVNDHLEQYDGTTAVVRTLDVAPLQIEFMRWQAERWMKLRHFPVALLHNPTFMLRNGRRFLGHTFRGCNLKTLLGFEDEHLAFERYRSLRAEERVYI
jgi:radical SAM superfamily enzyme YgiQ (UPF0313 family)